MEITLEQIELVKNKTNVSFLEAKLALERNNGDVLASILDIEGQQDTFAKPEPETRFTDKIKSLIQKGNDTYIIIKKKDNTVLNINANVAILIGIFGTPVAIGGLVGAWATQHEIQLQKDNGQKISLL